MALLTVIDTLDGVLREHAGALGRDRTAYRNHAYRVANLCAAQSDGAPETIERIAIAAAFHDLGIWTDGTFDYLAPSVALATAHLARIGRPAWTAEVTAMIEQHHRVRRIDGRPLVEAFRRADWADVTRGLVASGLPRPLLAAVFAAWPSAAFHRRLLQLELRRLLTHPLNPLPMLRW